MFCFHFDNNNLENCCLTLGVSLEKSEVPDGQKESNSIFLLSTFFFQDSLKGGDPAAPSGTATLLRLHPSYQSLH